MRFHPRVGNIVLWSCQNREVTLITSLYPFFFFYQKKYSIDLMLHFTEALERSQFVDFYNLIFRFFTFVISHSLSWVRLCQAQHALSHQVNTSQKKKKKKKKHTQGEL